MDRPAGGAHGTLLNHKRRKHAMPFEYRVQFRPGRYRYVEHTGPSGRPIYMIGRADDGELIGWSFDEERAKHIMLALNLVNAYISHDTKEEREILVALNKLRGH